MCNTVYLQNGLQMRLPFFANILRGFKLRDSFSCGALSTIIQCLCLPGDMAC